MEYAALVILVVTTFAEAGNLVIGSNMGRKFYDRQQFAEPMFWKQISDVTIECSPNEYISRVEITDLRPDKRGEVVLIDGGIGSRFVTLQLRSPTRLRGFNFRVQVFAEQSDRDYDGMDDRTDMRFLKFLKGARVLRI